MKIKILGSTIKVIKGKATVEDPGVKPNERDIRAFYSRSLAKAARKGTRSVAFAPIGCKAGFPELASAKISAQEILKHLRGKGPFVKEIAFIVGKEAIRAFDKGVVGYLRYFTVDLVDRPFTTADVIIEVPGGIVLIERSNPPFGYALPGGFIDTGESLEKCAEREAKEETGLSVYALRQFHTYSEPGRDPRFHSINTVFVGKSNGRPKAGSDAASVRVVKPKDLKKVKFAFDHDRILADYLKYKAGRDLF